MKKNFVLLILLNLLFIGCKKESNTTQAEIPGVTNIPWQIFGLMKNPDPIIPPYAFNWIIKFNSDNTFKISLHDSISTGTYSWIQVDSTKAAVNFNIQEWKYSITDTIVSNRLRYILTNVDSCQFLNRVNQIYNPLQTVFDLPYTTKGLWFHGNGGWVQVIHY